MRKVSIILLVVVILVCGCDWGYNRFSAGASGHDDALTVIQKCVPYINGMDLRLDRITLLETDSYGRCLFEYDMGLNTVSVLLVIQQTSASKVYYYEDYCYVLRQGDGVEHYFTEQDKNWIKEYNDWDKPINENLMCSVNFEGISPGGENVENIFATRESIRTHFKAMQPEKDWQNMHVDLNGLETYQKLGQLILVQLYNIKTKSQEFYLVLYNKDSGRVIQTSKVMNSVDEFRECIISFKANLVA